MSTDTTTQLACAACGKSDNIWAWYDVPERQDITLEGIGEDGRVKYEYAGCTKSGDCASDDTGFYCSDCTNYADTLEELLGLPKVEVPQTAIYDSHGGDTAFNARLGEAVTVIRPLTSEEADIEEVGAMYRVRFEADGFEADVFEDELYAGPFVWTAHGEEATV